MSARPWIQARACAEINARLAFLAAMAFILAVVVGAVGCAGW